MKNKTHLQNCSHAHPKKIQLREHPLLEIPVNYKINVCVFVYIKEKYN